MVSFPRYFTVCITYQPPLVHYRVQVRRQATVWLFNTGAASNTSVTRQNIKKESYIFYGLP